MNRLIIGIPRALLYYWYGFYWEQFWKKAGFEVITSSVTNRQIMMAGNEMAVDELCLPMKIFLGHVQTLASQVDLIMIPHLIKVESDAYICPKFMGLPDIVRHALPALKEKLLIVKVGPDLVDMPSSLKKASLRLGIKQHFKLEQEFSGTPNGFWETPALNIINSHLSSEFGKSDYPSESLTIALLGHPYCLYDPCFNLNLFHLLTNFGVEIVTPEMIPPSYHGIGAGRLEKKLFWTTGRFQFDALEWMLHGLKTPPHGFIQIAPFGCGPEAIVGDMIERRIKEAQKPFLRIYYEEHSGEAGIITRLEAFLDLIRYHSAAC